MLLSQNIREVIIVLLAYLLWGWPGAGLAFLGLLCLNFVEALLGIWWWRR